MTFNAWSQWRDGQNRTEQLVSHNRTLIMRQLWNQILFICSPIILESNLMQFPAAVHKNSLICVTSANHFQWPPIDMRWHVSCLVTCRGTAWQYVLIVPYWDKAALIGMTQCCGLYKLTPPYGSCNGSGHDVVTVALEWFVLSGLQSFVQVSTWQALGAWVVSRPTCPLHGQLDHNRSTGCRVWESAQICMC